MIDNAEEFAAALAQLARLYGGIRQLYEAGAEAGDPERAAARLLLAAGKMVMAVSALTGEIEEYSGAGTVRVLAAEYAAVRRRRGGVKESM